MTIESNQSSDIKNALLYQDIDGSGAKFGVFLAAEEDLSAIVAIYNENIDSKMATADLEPINVSDRQAWLASSQQNPNRPIYVVTSLNKEAQRGAVMAWGSFGDYKSRPAYHITSEISIYVSQNYQRRKLASHLLAWMINQAPALGIKNIVALIFAHNLRSLSLFKQYEFATWGTLPKVCNMDDFEADVKILGKRLKVSLPS